VLAQDFILFLIINFLNQIHISLPIRNMFLIGQPRIIFFLTKVFETHTMQHNFDETNFFEIFITQWCNFHAKSDVPKKNKLLLAWEVFLDFF